MSHAGLVARLAVRELWMTFRLVAMLVVLTGAGAVVALLPAPPTALLERLAIGLAAATAFCAAVAAWSIAADRTRGRAGWLVSRAVSRGSILAGWFVAVAGTAVLGVAAAALLGWLAAAAVARLPAGEWVVTAGSIAATAAAAVAVGCVVGLLLPPRLAAAITVLLVLGLGTASLVPGAADGVPGHAFVALASAEASAGGSGTGARDAGMALVAAAVLLVVGGAIIERVDL